MEKVEGETTTDVHHRGVWLAYELVNGFDFWQNEASENNKLAGKVVSVRVDDLKSGDREGQPPAAYSDGCRRPVRPCWKKPGGWCFARMLSSDSWISMSP